MTMRNCFAFARLAVAALAALVALPARADSHRHHGDAPLQIATGQFITPTAPRGAVQQLLNPRLPGYPGFVAGEAVRSQLSPDGKTLAILCAGQNSLVKPDGTLDVANSTQYIFLYDVSGRRREAPVLAQVIQQTNAHVGLVFGPDGKLYAAGGRDDAVYVYAKTGASWSQSAKIELGHAGKGVGIGVSPNASGIGISPDGRTLVVANNYNDSISVIDTASGAVRFEHDLRPYFTGNEGQAGGVGGTFPFGVVVKGNGVAYISSDRNREVIAVDIRAGTGGRLVQRIKLDGNALGMTLEASGGLLFVAEDNADQVAVIDTDSNRVVRTIDARAPAGILTHEHGRSDGDGDGDGDDEFDRRQRDPRLTGAATFAVTLARDGRTLYAVNAGSNSIAVIPIRGEHAFRVRGLIPTAYEPHDITLSADGGFMYVVNGKSVTGPNPAYVAGATATPASMAANQYQFQLERASLVSAPVPDADDFERLTQQVAENNFYIHQFVLRDFFVMEFLRHRIKHVIYVVKENRTYDQILGDLGNGANGDKTITQFGQAITPNFHRIANQFVTLDNFTDPGDGSMDGWSWSLQGRVTNTETITQQINYAFVDRGLSYESEGANRGVPVNWPTVAERDAIAGPPGSMNYSAITAGVVGGTHNLLTGTGNHASSDSPEGAQRGYIFDAVLQAGGTVRNYGFLVFNIGSIGTLTAPVIDPFAMGVVQVGPLDPSLAPFTDVYFRGFDQAYPDLWRFNEWKREFDGYVASGDLPSLSLVRLSHDHMGSFGSALAGVNTPETQQADDDLAVGRLAQAVADSPYAKSTLIIVTEDDCQDGPDHVDSHRATAYVIGPYVKQGAVVSTHYSQVNVLRTIEDILGTQHMNLNTAFQGPMADIFDVRSSGQWSYVAEASTVLSTTQLAAGPDGLGAPFAKGDTVKPRHDAAYWAKVTAGFDFSEADRVPPDRFNRVLWAGMIGRRPYPRLTGRHAAARRDADD